MERKSNIELLRILSIIFVLFHHFFYNNIIFDYMNNLTVNQFCGEILYSLGKIGVNVFIIITGYFSINSKFKIKKAITICLETIFYSWFILIIYMTINGLQGLEAKSILRSIFPIIYNHYWFITVYIIIYFLSDYINILLKSISRKQYIFLISLLLIIWCILPSILMVWDKFIPTYSYTQVGFSNIDWFVLMYMIGAFIRIHPIKIFDDIKKINIVLIIFISLGILSVYVLDKLNINPTYFSLPMNQIIPLTISICLFLFFLNLKINSNNVINRIASCTLGIYLIHTNIILRDLIWVDILNVNNYTNSKYLVIYAIFAVAIVFLICMIIDLIRQIIFNRYINKFIEFFSQKLRLE